MSSIVASSVGTFSTLRRSEARSCSSWNMFRFASACCKWTDFKSSKTRSDSALVASARDWAKFIWFVKTKICALFSASARWSSRREAGVKGIAAFDEDAEVLLAEAAAVPPPNVAPVRSTPCPATAASARPSLAFAESRSRVSTSMVCWSSSCLSRIACSCVRSSVTWRR